MSDQPGNGYAKRAHKTVDELLGMLSEIADDPDAGADKFRAIKLLMSANSAGVTVPEPRTPQEIEQMGILLFRWWGRDTCQKLWHLAFRKAKRGIHEPPSIGEQFLTPEQRALVLKVQDVKTLYRIIPEIKRGGRIPGFPVGKGREVQREFCRRLAIKIFIDREQKKVEKDPPPETIDAREPEMASPSGD